MIRGHDYLQGVDVERTRAQWRELLTDAAFTRRVGGDLLAFKRRPDGGVSLEFEIYDGGVLGRPRRQELR